MDRTQTLIASAFVLALAHSAVSAAATPVDFSREILPILSNKCFVCHGPDVKKKDLVRLDSFEEATRDLDGYKAINPEAPEDSEIIVRATTHPWGHLARASTARRRVQLRR